MAQASKAYGLDINKAKTNILIMNTREMPAEIGAIKLTDSIKYLGNAS